MLHEFSNTIIFNELNHHLFSKHISEYQKRIVKNGEFADVMNEKKNPLFQNFSNVLAIILFQEIVSPFLKL